MKSIRKRFEYELFYHKGYTAESVSKCLNEYGEDGWEIVADNSENITFKREKRDDENK